MWNPHLALTFQSTDKPSSEFLISFCFFLYSCFIDEAFNHKTDIFPANHDEVRESFQFKNDFGSKLLIY